jgi:energy-coupling factor transporter ATP-binding protein EcfA2
MDSERLAGRLTVLRARLHRDLDEIRALRAFDDRAPIVGGLLDDVDRQLQRSRGAMVVVVAGPTGSGKSTLVNALCGEEVSLEGVDRPTTSAPTIVAPTDADLVPLLEGLPGPAPRVLRRDARGLTSRAVVVDAPDVNSVAVEHRALVQALVERADVVVACLHRQAVVEASTSRFMARFRGLRRVLWVLARADELSDEPRAALERQLAEVTAAPADDRFTLSAARARSQGDAGFDRLVARLGELVGDEGALGVRCHNALGAAARVGRELDAVASAAAPGLEALPGTLRAGLDRLVEEVVAELDVRLDLRAKPIASMLLGEAGRRWEGPGGWVLRAGSWATIGTGLGLALARRAPLAGAGVAVAGAAVGAARQGLEQRALSDSAGLLPEAGRLDSAWRQQLSDARVTVDRLVLEREALAFPSPGRVENVLDEAAREGWQRLLDRDLPLAAERTAPLWLRWILDAPVYALAGWVAWVVVRGFFAGDYAGVDFLLNATLIAIAGLWLVRAFVAILARARAARLVGSVRTQIRSSLEQNAGELVAHVEERCEAHRSRLRELSALEARWRATLGAS